MAAFQSGFFSLPSVNLNDLVLSTPFGLYSFFSATISVTALVHAVLVFTYCAMTEKFAQVEYALQARSVWASVHVHSNFATISYCV